MRSRKWTKEKVIEEVEKRVKEGKSIKYQDIAKEDVGLKNAIYNYVGGINKLKQILKEREEEREKEDNKEEVTTYVETKKEVKKIVIEINII